MSVPIGEVENTVLHIRPLGVRNALSECAAGVEGLAGRAGFRVCGIGDVYRGLAELCRAESEPAAVVVCVDELGPAEMEFFSLVARHRPGLAVAVYGGGRSAARVERARGMGATGNPDEGFFRRLAGDIGVTLRDEDTAHRAVAHEEKMVGDAHPTGPTHGNERWVASNHPNDSIEEDEGETPSEEDLPTGPVRVPWLKYGDGPVRTGPRREPPNPSIPPRREPPNASIPLRRESPIESGVARFETPIPFRAEASPGESEVEPLRAVGATERPPGLDAVEPIAPREPVAEEYEPLLTDEELRALLGDDFGMGTEGMAERSKGTSSPGGDKV